jgi:hypothetical protein
MKWFRLLCVASVGLLGASWASADTIPGHFFIDLNNNFSLTDDVGGWGAGNGFTDSVNTGTSTRGFTQSDFCPQNDQGNCDHDPYILLNAGGHSDPFGTSFSADANGGGILDYFNGGTSPITDLLIITDLNPNGQYHCSSDIFAFCGFKDPPGQTLEILFSKGTIPVATPEPGYSLLLLIAGGALIAARQIRARKVSA